jgi:hypothetical protein
MVVVLVPEMLMHNASSTPPVGTLTLVPVIAPLPVPGAELVD